MFFLTHSATTEIYTLSLHDALPVFFTPEGKFLYQFGKFGDGPGEFMRPQSLVIDGETLYIADACNHRIDVFKDRKSTRLNSSHVSISYAVFCLKKKKKEEMDEFSVA